MDHNSVGLTCIMLMNFDPAHSWPVHNGANAISLNTATGGAAVL